MPDLPRIPRLPTLALGVIVAIALMARLVLFVSASGRFDDPDNYLPLARSLANGQGLVLAGRLSAYRPPLYPILLALLVACLPTDRVLWGVAGLNLFLAGATVILVAATARRLGMTTAQNLCAAVIVGFDPVLLIQSRSIMTETPAAFLVSLTLFLSTLKGNMGAVAAGVGLGLASLCRPSLLPAAGLTSLMIGVCAPGRWPTRVVRSLGLIAATLVCLAPWALRNAFVFGEPVWTTTHGGYTLALANNPVYDREVLHGPPGAVWTGENQRQWQADLSRSVDNLPEPEADRRVAALTWQWIGEHPRSFAQGAVARLGRLWGVAPSGSVYPFRVRLATALWTGPLWVALLMGLFCPRFRQWPGVMAPIFLATLTVVHVFYWTDLRMRAPIVPAIALVAAGWSEPARAIRRFAVEKRSRG